MTRRVVQEDIYVAVEKIVLEHLGEDVSLLPTTNLKTDFDIDSIEFIELGITMEKAFAIHLPSTELRKCVTLTDLTKLVQQTLAA